MTVEISPLTAADHDEWLPLWAGYLEFYRETLSDEQTELTFSRFLDPEVMMWGAIARDETGRALGIVHWLRHSSTWSIDGHVYLEDLFVAPDARGAGVGRALITEVTEWARVRRLYKVYWHTENTNATARLLYDKLGKQEYVVYEVDLD